MIHNFLKQPGKQKLSRGLNSDSTPLISIITAYYNGGTYFEQTYNCVVNQTFPWFEWIIVDDGSNRLEDVSLLDLLAKQDNRIQVLHQNNGGLANARNAGIKCAKCDIILPLDSDDLIEPNYIEMLYWALYHHPEASWAYTDSCGFQGQEYIWCKQFSGKIMKHDNILCATAAIRKQDILEQGGYDELSKHFFEDWALWLKLMSAGKYPVHISSVSFWYRRSQTGELNKASANQDQVSHLRLLAKKVNDDMEAVVYPRTRHEVFQAPKRSQFDQKTYQKHDKTRVLMLLPWMNVGGADQFNLDLVRMIDKEKFDISVLTTLSSENPLEQQFLEYTPEVFCLDRFMDTSDYPEFISYFIQSREIDVLMVSNSYHSYGLMPWLRKQFPDLVILDYVHMEEWYWRNGGFARCAAVMNGITETTCVCNERTRKILIDNFGRSAETVETVYIGVDHYKYDPANTPEGIMRDALNIIPSRPCVLFPCRLHLQKRPYLMLEIAKALKKRIHDVAFIVVGSGSELENIQESIHNEGLQDTVILAGEQNDLRPYYRDVQVTLICSLKEGLALTAYESCAMGTPVVSSDVGGQGELVDEDVGALLPLMQNEATDLQNYNYSHQEIIQYVDALEDILMDTEKRERMSRICRERVEKKFSIKNMAAYMEDIFNRLLSDSQFMQQRKIKSEYLQSLGNLAEEHYIILNEYENRSEECTSLFRLYHNTLIGNRESISLASDTQAFSGLNIAPGASVRILSPAMARFVDWLQHFSNKNAFGRLLKSMLRRTLSVFRRIAR